LCLQRCGFVFTLGSDSPALFTATTLNWYHFPSLSPGTLERNSLKLFNVAAWQLLNQLGSKILLQFPFVMGRRKAGFDCPDIWHSPIPKWQLPESLLADNLLHKRLVDTEVETMPK
jgi:hypothetical protein